MMSTALARVLGLGLLLIGTITFQLMGDVADGGALIVHTTFSAPPGPPAAALAPPVDRQKVVDELLARPLFAVTRRPAILLAGPVAVSANLPRLTGILVNGRSRSAIFEAPDGGRAVVAQEGGQIGAYTVRSIETRQVTLSSPDDTRILRPTFDLRPKDATYPAAVAALEPSATAITALQSPGGFSGAAR